MTTTVRTIFSINATDRSHDFLVIRRGPAGISIEAQSREDEWESATAGPFTPEQLRAALDEVAPAGSYTRTDEPDDMDGGVTAALIEKEAEQRSCPDLDAHWRLDEAQETIQRLTQERDEARADLAEYVQAQALRAQPRPITADDIESVLHSILPLSTEHLGPDDIADIASDLYTALTEPPRPEGAEELEALLWNGSEDDEMTVLDTEDRRLISNYLASRGVRIVTEEQP